MTAEDEGNIVDHLYVIQRTISGVRYQRRWSQQEAANLLDIARETLSYIENGKQKLTAEMLLRMSIVYEVPVAQLLRLDHWEGWIEPAEQA